MKPPIINWILKEKEIFNEAFLGAFVSSELFKVSLDVWNNRFGVEAVQDIVDAKFVFEFKDYEDSALLSHIQVKCDNHYFAKLEVDGQRGYLKCPKIIRGTPNNGSVSSYDNHIVLEIALDKNLPVKADLKQLMIDIIH